MLFLKIYSDDIHQAYFESIDGNKQVEMYFVPDVTLDNLSIWFGNYIVARGDNFTFSSQDYLTIEDQPFVSFSSVIEFDDVEWEAQYFATVNTFANTLYIVGVRELVDPAVASSLEEDFLGIRDTLELRFGSYSLFKSITAHDNYAEYRLNAQLIELHTWCKPLLFWPSKLKPKCIRQHFLKIS